MLVQTYLFGRYRHRWLPTLRQRYGAPAGRVRGLYRFVVQNGARITEVLADPRSGIVMESSVTDDGALRERTCFDYSARADGSLFRHTIRNEQIPAEPGQERGVVTMAFANLTVGSGR